MKFHSQYIVIAAFFFGIFEGRGTAQYFEAARFMSSSVFGSGFGYTVAVSGDGKTALAGSSDGPVEVFERSGTQWSFVTYLVPVDGNPYRTGKFYSAALSNDGNTAVVAELTDSDFHGALFVFRRAGAKWAQFGAKLKPVGDISSNAVGGPFGQSLAISSDSSTIVAGGPGDNTNNGAIWIYQLTGKTWSPGTKLTLSNFPTSSRFGTSVAASADGSTIVVSGESVPPTNRALWLFHRAANTWAEDTTFVPPPYVGGSVSISSDGNTILAQYSNGAVVLQNSNGAWSQQGGTLVARDVSPGGTSKHVLLSQDGNTAIVGAWDDGHNGAVWVFARSGSGWHQQGVKLVGTGCSNSCFQGWTIAVSQDARSLIVGGNTNGGYVWDFEIPPGPVIASGGVVNGASFTPGISPGTWITIEGVRLVASTRTWNSADFAGDALPTSLDGTSVTIDGKSAYVAYVSPTQLNVLAPDSTKMGPVAIEVKTAGGTSNVMMTEQLPLAPAIFTYTLNGIQYAAATFADGTLITPQNAVHPNDIVSIYGTGCGPTDPSLMTGFLNQGSAPLSSPVSADFSATKVLYAGLVGPGLCQFNIQLPFSISGNTYGVGLFVGGVQSNYVNLPAAR